MKEQDEQIFFEANRLLVELRHGGCCSCQDISDYLNWLNRTIAVVFAHEYMYEHYDQEEDFFKEWCYVSGQVSYELDDFHDDIERSRMVFNMYNHNNDIMWTVLAYVFENRVGNGSAAHYEQSCMDDDYYIEMGRIFKKTLKDAAI